MMASPDPAGPSGRTAPATAITHGRILAIALPIVASNATIPLLGVVDTAIIGQLGQAAAIGAVGLGAVILSSLYWILSFLRMATTGLAAQARGAGDTAESSALLMRGLVLAAAAGLGFILLQGPLIAGALRLAPASPEAEALARSYLGIRIWGAPATIAGYAVTGWLIAAERTRAVLALQLATNLLNVLLSVGFVLGLGWGVPGVAGATLLAEWAGLALGLWLCRDALAGPGWRDRARLLAPDRLRRMAGVSGDILVRSVVLQGSFTAFVFLGAGLGDVTLAANQILLQFLSVTAYALDGFAFAAESLVGQAVGAGRRDALRRTVLLTCSWGGIGALVLSLAFALIGPACIALMTTAPDVQAAARADLPWLILAPLAGVGAWMLDGIFIGATRTREMRNAMLLSVAGYAAVLAVFLPVLGNNGLWLALTFLNLARAVTLGILYPKLEAGLA